MSYVVNRQYKDNMYSLIFNKIIDYNIIWEGKVGWYVIFYLRWGRVKLYCFKQTVLVIVGQLLSLKGQGGNERDGPVKSPLPLGTV